MNHLVGILTDGATELTRSFFVEVMVAMLLSSFGVLAFSFRTSREWKLAQFSDRINISLNLISKETLRIRTVLEDQVGKLILSPYARKLVKKATARTTTEDEFLRFPTERDSWMVYNEIINGISEIYGAHLLEAAVRGKELIEVPFLIAITYERNKDIRIRKLRVLVVEESVLKQIDEGYGGAEVGVETDNHRLRVHTLKKMYDQFRKGSWPQYQIVSLPRL